MSEEYSPKFCKYMPSAAFPDKKGSALQLSIVDYKRDNKKTKTVVMVEMVVQSKPKPPTGSTESGFDWATDKIFMSLKDIEVAGIIAVIQGAKQELNVIHKYPIDGPEDQQKTSSLNVKMNEYNGIMNLLIKMSQKKPGSKEYHNVQIAFQPEEIIILKTILEGAIRKMYNV